MGFSLDTPAAAPVMRSDTEVATQLGVHVDTVRRLRANGGIRSIRVGGQWRTSQSEVDRICAEGAS